jgi:hypothetical protein
VSHIVLAVRLNGCLLQEAADLRHGNSLHDLPRDGLVTQFPERPVVDRPARQLRRLARQGHDLGHLLGGERRRGARSRGVREDVEDRLTQTMGLGTFPHAQRIPGVPPSLPPKAHLLSVQADPRGDLVVEEPLEPEHNDRRPLRDALADGTRLAEFLQQNLLSFADNDLGGRPGHWSISCLTIEGPGKIRHFQVSCYAVSAMRH